MEARWERERATAMATLEIEATAVGVETRTNGHAPPAPFQAAPQVLSNEWAETPQPAFYETPMGVLIRKGECPTCSGPAGAFATVEWGSAQTTVTYRALGETERNRVAEECLNAIANRSAVNTSARDVIGMARRALDSLKAV